MWICCDVGVIRTARFNVYLLLFEFSRDLFKNRSSLLKGGAFTGQLRGRSCLIWKLRR